ncbi:FUSC family protein [Georgenia sp. EYE_87]|uniref:FUSC family protein n=1 Tax=Georgenia sp. EYE_87 TaxID=2853448 RepID=UPI002005D0A2|nr:FUSC family protein [Georgenia sp. EYE_87]MCK6209728.1 FUSC family protein [Georgenia sp. EYE_87]
MTAGPARPGADRSDEGRADRAGADRSRPAGRGDGPGADPPGTEGRPHRSAAQLVAAGIGRTMDLRRWRVVLRVQARQGRRRTSDAFAPILTAALAAGLAYLVSGSLLGHELPMFAPIAAWVCLGFSPDRQLRRVAEMGAGVTLGVGLGELFAALFGAGPVQIFAVLLISALTARFLDRGQLFTTQAGVQSIVIVAMPASMFADGAVGRWSDALVGAALALLVTALLPGDVVRRPRRLGQEVLSELASMLATLGRGLRSGDAQLAADALAQGRGSQGGLDAWVTAVRSAKEVVRVNPALRAERATIAELGRVSTLADRAMRNARVVCRRAVVAIEEDGPSPDIADEVDAVAAALSSLAAAIGHGDPPEHARATLVRVSATLVPVLHAEEGWRKQTLVSLLRSLVVDALQMTGMSRRQAMAQLAEG